MQQEGISSLTGVIFRGDRKTADEAASSANIRVSNSTFFLLMVVVLGLDEGSRGNVTGSLKKVTRYQLPVTSYSFLRDEMKKSSGFDNYKNSTA